MNKHLTLCHSCCGWNAYFVYVTRVLVLYLGNLYSLIIALLDKVNSMSSAVCSYRTLDVYIFSMPFLMAGIMFSPAHKGNLHSFLCAYGGSNSNNGPKFAIQQFTTRWYKCNNGEVMFWAQHLIFLYVSWCYVWLNGQNILSIHLRCEDCGDIFRI